MLGDAKIYIKYNRMIVEEFIRRAYNKGIDHLEVSWLDNESFIVRIQVDGEIKELNSDNVKALRKFNKTVTP